MTTSKDPLFKSFVSAVLNSKTKVFPQLLEQVRDNPEIKAQVLAYSHYGMTDSLLAAAIKDRSPKLSLDIIEGLASLGKPTSDRAEKTAWSVAGMRLDQETKSHPKYLQQSLNNYVKVVKILIDHQIGTKNLEFKCWTPPHMVIAALAHIDPKHSRDLLEYMQDQGVNINQVDEIGETPLAVAFWHLDLQSARYLLENGADHQAMTNGKRTIGSFLFRSWSAKDKSEHYETIIKAIQLLIEFGYDLDTLQKDAEKATVGYQQVGAEDRIQHAVKCAKSLIESQELKQSTIVSQPKRQGIRL